MRDEFQEAYDIEKKRVKALRKKKIERVKPQVTEENLEVLASVLERMRWNDQGGFSSLHDGKWGFASTGLPQTTPKELDALFALAGVVPDEIEPVGECKTCKWSEGWGGGWERGYHQPCSGCLRPLMSRYVSADEDK